MVTHPVQHSTLLAACVYTVGENLLSETLLPCHLQCLLEVQCAHLSTSCVAFGDQVPQEQKAL